MDAGGWAIVVATVPVALLCFGIVVYGLSMRGAEMDPTENANATEAYYDRRLSGVSTTVEAGWEIVHIPSHRTIAYCTEWRDVQTIIGALNWWEITAYEYRRRYGRK